MKEMYFTIEEINHLFIACIGQQQRSHGRSIQMYEELQKKMKDLAKCCTRDNDFEVEVLINV